MPEPLNTIIDNRESNTILEALKRLLPESNTLDVATGYFEIGALLALDGYWNALEHVEILMGDETTKRTRTELANAIKALSEDSLEKEKEKDDSLRGLAAIRQALENKQIEAKVYTQAKFHAKAFMMKMKPPHLSNYAIIGSSNFTEPGLCRNMELNLLTTEQHQLGALQEWYGHCWKQSEDIKDVILKVIEPHLKHYSPFEVYAKAMHAYFLGREVSTTAWETNESRIYPMLDDLQKDGYRQALWISENWGGSLICDGVGFGKTFIGLMLIERFLHERKKVALIVPKSARASVWESRLQKYLNLDRKAAYGGSDVEIINHTDLARENEDVVRLVNGIQERADVVIVDEAHHFRSRAALRGLKLFDLIENRGRKKKLFLMTATPINNSLFDILHLVEYFTRDKRDYFQKLGISDSRNYFVKMEKAIDVKMGLRPLQDDQEELMPDFPIEEAERVLRNDVLFRELVIQRSRARCRFQTARRESPGSTRRRIR